MIVTYNPMRLTADISLLETDVQQLRLHLDWLLTDLYEQHDQMDDQADTLAGLATDVAGYLPQLDGLEALLVRIEQVMQQRQHWPN